MTTITQTADVLIQGIEVGQEIYQTVLNAMDAAEQEKQSGQDKKAWVVAFIKSFLFVLGIVTGKQIGRASCRERVSSPV